MVEQFLSSWEKNRPQIEQTGVAFGSCASDVVIFVLPEVERHRESAIDSRSPLIFGLVSGDPLRLTFSALLAFNRLCAVGFPI